jgi:hypothetical protein
MLRAVRPPRPDIAVPPIPPGLEWVGDPVESIERMVAARPALVHFFDFAQLNSVRVLPYLRAWHERYGDDGLAVIGVHSPRFPFTQSVEAVAGAAARLEIDWPVAVDTEFVVWRQYEPHGWPALFLWGQGGALRWYHLGEGEYQGTEEVIRELLRETGADGEWPPALEPLRATDAPGVEVVAPSAEVFPGGSTEKPWTASEAGRKLEVDYVAGGAYAASDGEGEISVRLDGEPAEPIAVTDPGLQELTAHERGERHHLELEPSEGLRIYSLQFAVGMPPG